MKKSYVAGCTVVLTLLVSSFAAAQTQSIRGNVTASQIASTAPPTFVSVRELSIPKSARNAFEKGIASWAKTDFAGSVRQFQRAIEEFPDYYEAYFSLGATQLKLGHEEEAEQSFNKSVNLSAGQYPLAFLGLGIVQCDRMDFNEAISLVQKAFALNGDPALGYFVLGVASFGLDRLDDAEKDAHEAISRQPNYPDPFLLLVHIHSRQGRQAELVEDFNRYIALDRDIETRTKAKAILDEIEKASRESSATTPQ